ncbi:helix-turn-helix domain-containing protein [Petroclostridium sp. X23]|uniref:helix-turn-helix domain-containing protein n=1 Tax=Petroclostridium sp. X23 TaxID=3045146 RepID=UPI0024AE33B2|nr:helix-turn-helix domain-containing protein [Petroclostridium sp. X23]WHH59079.1 helix-turn-helix domain-containing protein [Petroclostridium sp. X23]
MKRKYVNDYKFNSIFVKTLLVLMMFSLIPLIATNAVIYRRSIAIIQKQAHNINMNMLVKTNEAVDLIFKQVDDIVQQIAKDSDVVELVIDPASESFTNSHKIIGKLMNVSYASNYISSVYVYNTYNDKIYSSTGGVYKFSDFYDKDWFKDYNKFIIGTSKLETRKISDALGNQFNCITFIRNIPFSSWSKLGAVIVNINEEKLYELVSGVNTEDNGVLYVVNRDGKILLHKEKSKLRTYFSDDPSMNAILKDDSGYVIQHVNGKKMLVTYTTSGYNGWKYIYSIPLEELQKDSKIISKMIKISAIIYILFALVFSFLISKGMYEPIERLINLILASSKDEFFTKGITAKDEYEFLNYAYNDVIDKNKSMEDAIKSIKPMVKEKLFTNLIMGKRTSLEEILEKLKLLSIDFHSTNFIVVVMQIDNYSEFCKKFDEIDRSIYKINLMAMAETVISSRNKGVCIEIESDKIAAIINCTNEGISMQARDELLLMIEKIKNEVKKHFPFTITQGVGRVYKSIVDIKLSYNEAIIALKYKLYQGTNEVINIDDIEVQSEELYYHNSEKEKMIVNNLRIGQYKEVETLVEEMAGEILNNRSISYESVQQVFVRLVNGIVELIINMGMTVDEIFGKQANLYEQLAAQETIEDIKVWLMKICRTISDEINSTNSDKSQKNAERILEYINENLSKDISLNEVADLIGFSRAYVSKIFKDYTGKNYTDYVNGNRIEKAKQLLKDSQLSIKEVGFRVGFNSIQTFMRTFKKYEGITPGQYRDNIRI